MAQPNPGRSRPNYPWPTPTDAPASARGADAPVVLRRRPAAVSRRAVGNAVHPSPRDEAAHLLGEDTTVSPSVKPPCAPGPPQALPDAEESAPMYARGSRWWQWGNTERHTRHAVGHTPKTAPERRAGARRPRPTATRWPACSHHQQRHATGIELNASYGRRHAGVRRPAVGGRASADAATAEAPPAMAPDRWTCVIGGFSRCCHRYPVCRARGQSST